MNWFAIAAGGALGALLRAGVSHWFKSSPGHFPWGTFTVNVLGCLLMGALYVLIMERHWVDPAWRPFLMVGLLGAPRLRLRPCRSGRQTVRFWPAFTRWAVFQDAFWPLGWAIT